MTIHYDRNKIHFLVKQAGTNYRTIAKGLRLNPSAVTQMLKGDRPYPAVKKALEAVIGPLPTLSGEDIPSD